MQPTWFFYLLALTLFEEFEAALENFYKKPQFFLMEKRYTFMIRWLWIVRAVTSSLGLSWVTCDLWMIFSLLANVTLTK